MINKALLTQRGVKLKTPAGTAVILPCLLESDKGGGAPCGKGCFATGPLKSTDIHPAGTRRFLSPNEDKSEHFCIYLVHLILYIWKNS